VKAALVALPLLGLASSLLAWRGEMWRHLAETQLGEIVANTVLLLLGVGFGTIVIGTATAWLVTMHRFPLSRAQMCVIQRVKNSPAGKGIDIASA